jgi:alkaline phosphatase
MTGFPSRTGYVSTYPVQDPENDIYPTDPARAFQPLTTVLEAAKQLQGRSTGLVFTCEFPQATPADCSSHSYNRGKYDWIAPQMAHNDITVVIGGGTSLLPAESEEYLKKNGYAVYKDDIKGMRSYNGNKLWSLFGARDMSYEADRDTAAQPSLEEMTKKAIGILSQNPNGFFLMVEGSKVDWAAHANDPVGMTGDFLAFDKACGAALDFALKNGETAVVILPDHGNSGISIGRLDCKGYDKLTKDQLFNQLSQYKATSNKLAAEVNKVPNSEVQKVFDKYAGIQLTDEELQALNNCKDYKQSPIPEDQRSSKNVQASLYSGSLTTFMSKLLTSRTCLGFTTNGHTGEEVFLACYHPQGTRATGLLTNIELNEYLCNLFGMTRETLEGQTAENFAPHQKVFADYQCTIVPSKEEKGLPTLVVKAKKGKKQLNITPNSNVVTYGKKGENTVQLNSVVVYVDQNNTFYLPKKLVEYLQ